MTTFFEEEPKPETRVPQPGLKTALSIAGLDPSGGAGIIADVRAFDALGVYGTAALTTVTYQNTTGMYGRLDMPEVGILRQIENVFEDRMPNAIKTGAFGSSEAVEVVGRLLADEYGGPLVVDPVALSSSGATLLDEDGVAAIAEHLLPGATMVTPNVSEVEFLSDFEVFDLDDVEAAALRVISLGVRSVLVTGKKVERAGEVFSADVFCDGREIHTFTSPWIGGAEMHGTGCLLSAAIAACLARGMTCIEAVMRGRRLVRLAMKAPLFPGRGAPVADPFSLRERLEAAEAEDASESAQGEEAEE